MFKQVKKGQKFQLAIITGNIQKREFYGKKNDFLP